MQSYIEILTRGKSKLNIKSSYIVNPLYDNFFFILSPILALLLGIAVSYSEYLHQPVTVFNMTTPLIGILLSTMIFSHLFAVFFRSHLNTEIFWQYPNRFILAPVFLLIGMLLSDWIFVCVGVLAMWWDVYHSSLQTFGFARIYDMKIGNNLKKGRRLDYILNLFLYFGPVLAGVELMTHVNDFHEFEQVGNLFFTTLPERIFDKTNYIRYSIITSGVAFLCYYFYYYYKLYRNGYAISLQKTILLFSTGLCSIYTWGFNSFGKAFFIMNVFHAMQYFAIVWHMEKQNMIKKFRLPNNNLGKYLALFIFLFITILYGFYTTIENYNVDNLFAFSLVVSIMHFWYDGFIWSVQKKHPGVSS